jgi:DNA mismatch repair protein MSH5
MTTENVIDIEQGRHLLQELSVAQYVPNDAYLIGGQEQAKSSESDTATSCSSKDLPSVLIVTGPNNSGKSIYMKQVALIVYLAQVGRRVLCLAMLRFLI